MKLWKKPKEATQEVENFVKDAVVTADEKVPAYDIVIEDSSVINEVIEVILGIDHPTADAEKSDVVQS